MNRRRIRTQLHHQRNRQNFWGRRGMLTIRLPASVVPPKPDMSVFETYGPTVEAFGYQRETETEHGLRIFSMSSGVMSSGYPCDDDRIVFNIEDRSTQYGPDYTWSETRHVWIPVDKSRFKRIFLPVPDAHVKRMGEYVRWCDIVHGSYRVKNLPKVVEVLMGYGMAKTHYVTVTPEFYEFTYAVKPWYVRAFVKRDCNRILNQLDRMVKSGDLTWYKVLR